jgi:hypothetical protein
VAEPGDPLSKSGNGVTEFQVVLDLGPMST